MARKRKVGNLLALAVLSYLSASSRCTRTSWDGPCASTATTRSIKFNHGSLYMVVGQLARAGFITEQETSRDGQRPERTVYALTEAGRGELRDWLARPGRAAAVRVPGLRGRAVADRGAAPRPGRSACCGHGSATSPGSRPRPAS